MLNFSVTEENYIKAIYHLQSKDSAAATNDIADALQARAASVTDMLKKLQRKKLIAYKPYYGCKLTEKGKGVALLIIRRHRLWEYFLSEKLGFKWQEVHAVAEELEHVGSEQLISKLDAFLGYPPFDPHGDPIPDCKGNIAAAQNISLATANANTSGKVVQISGQSPALLELLEDKNISIGSKIKVLKRSGFDQSVEVIINNKHITQITNLLAENIFIA